MKSYDDSFLIKEAALYIPSSDVTPRIICTWLNRPGTRFNEVELGLEMVQPYIFNQ